MLFQNILSAAVLLKIAAAAPLPAVITRIHTAEAVTVTNTYTAATTTIQLPPVEIFISDGVTYTFTLTESPAAEPTTFTTVYNHNVDPVTKPTDEPQSPDGPAATATQFQTTTNVVTINNTPPPSPAPTTQTTQTTPAAPTETTTTETTPTETTPAQNTPAQTTPTTSNTPAQTTPTTPNTPAQTTPTTPNTPAQTTPTTPNTPAQTTPTTPNTPAQTTPNTPNTPAQTTPTTPATPVQTTPNTPNTPAQTTPTTPATPVQTTKTTTQQQTTSKTTSGLSGTGTIPPPNAIVYSPYQDQGGCKTTSNIHSDLDYIKSLGINNVRIYGTDCGNWDVILPYCVQKGIQVDQGFWISTTSYSQSDVDSFIAYGQQSGWEVFNTLTVGNEVINSGYASADQLISMIQSVTSQVRAAGYNGPITTAEPPNSYISNTQLCNSGITFAGVNAHSYFDGSISADQSGPFIVGQLQIVKQTCPNIDAEIVETGFPSQGATNGLQVPSLANQKAAIASIMQSMAGAVTILSTYNDFWKDPGPYGIEQYFGAAYLLE